MRGLPARDKGREAIVLRPRLRSLLAAICTIIVAVLTGIIGSSIWEGLKDHVGAYSIAVLVITATIAALVQLWPEQDPIAAQRLEREFKALWPQLSKLLGADIKESVAAATEFRMRPIGTWPPALYRPLSRGIVNDHGRLINNYDPQLGKALKRYYDADEAMRRAVAEYKAALQEFKGSDDFWRCERGGQKLHKHGRRLEIMADNLGRCVQRRDERTK